MANITINGQSFTVEDGITIISACEQAGVEIPRFCYHEELEIAGNCRMCLVEVEKVPKPVASCAQAVAEGMVIKTNSSMVMKAREGVMEFLLINHPLDCPICDQGGECDLQDQAMFYGKSHSRYKDEKRAVSNKSFSPLINGYMTRCIHCTRCIRFLEDIAGVAELGAVNRGEDMEITTYIDKSLSSELSANIVDLCPVGALLSKPYAGKARPWELVKTFSLDITTAEGCNTIVCSKGPVVERILPRNHPEINGDWMSDKGRFAPIDGLRYQRLDRPMKRLSMRNSLSESTFESAFSVIKKIFNQLKPEQIGMISGDLVDLETMYAGKLLMQSIGSDYYDCRQNNLRIRPEDQGFYTFNTGISKIIDADLCLIVGSDPRKEAPVLNAKIRKAVVKHGMKVGVIGHNNDLTYPYRHLGNHPWILRQIIDGRHDFYQELKAAKNPLIIAGIDLFMREDYNVFMANFKKLVKLLNAQRDDWYGFSVLPHSAAIVGGMDLGFVPNDPRVQTAEIIANSKLLFLLAADEIDLNLIPQDAFVVYIGHHGDKAAARANVILPGAAFSEKDGTYVNMEGRVQKALQAVPPPGFAQDDRMIIIKLAEYLGLDLGAYSKEELEMKLAKEYPFYSQVDLTRPRYINCEESKLREFIHDSFSYNIENFYMTDPISRASRFMAQCTNARKEEQSA